MQLDIDGFETTPPDDNGTKLPPSDIWPTKPMDEASRKVFIKDLTSKLEELKFLYSIEDKKTTLREQMCYSLGKGNAYLGILNGRLVHKKALVLMHANTFMLLGDMEKIIEKYKNTYPDEPQTVD